MIRKFLLIAIIFCGIWACQDEKAVFDVPVEFQRISFEARPGGALMRYKLPDDLDIYRVRARYTNAFGEELVKDGSYMSDSLLLSGFTEARKNVPVQLSFFNKEMVESAPVEMTFDTEASATVALFDSLTVNPFWGGFNVTYHTPKTVESMVHVFYIGTNPTTQEPDSILMGSYPITEGGDTLNFTLTQQVDQLNVVVRTDDYSGHRVKKMVYEDIPSLMMDTLSPSDFDFFSYPATLIQERDDYLFGKEYLFDGKKKGDGLRYRYLRGERDKFETFIAGPNAFEESGARFIVDLKTPRVPAALYYYAWVDLGIGIYYTQRDNPYLYAALGLSGYHSRLPAKARVYGVKEGDDPKTVDFSKCALLYTLDDDIDYDYFYDKSWCRLTNRNNSQSTMLNLTDAEFAQVEPVVLKMMCNYSGEKFRYLILVVEDTYNTTNMNPEQNMSEYITCDELEVAVLAE